MLHIQTTANKGSKWYWLSRGWNEQTSLVNAAQIRKGKKKGVSVYSKEYWLNKINPNTNNLYTAEEADFERNSRRPIRPEYWTKQGYDDNDAATKAAEVKAKNNKEGGKKAANRDTANIRAFNHKTPEYWLLRGYTTQQAEDEIKKSQSVFSKKICIEKYGESAGLSIFNDRQQRWQETLNNKSQEEKNRINKAKLTKGIIISSNERYLFSEIVKVIPDAEHQFTLYKDNKRQYVYDIRHQNKIIEYNGDFWHANPKIYNESFINGRNKRSAVEIWDSDRKKILFAEDAGYEVLVVWEADFKANKEEIINKCINFLTQ
jgi:very-short-patch-repair endonuclease